MGSPPISNSSLEIVYVLCFSDVVWKAVEIFCNIVSEASTFLHFSKRMSNFSFCNFLANSDIEAKVSLPVRLERLWSTKQCQYSLYMSTVEIFEEYIHIFHFKKTSNFIVMLCKHCLKMI